MASEAAGGDQAPPARWRHFNRTVRITPDGIRYLQPNPPAPFHLRWFIPWLCRGNRWRWFDVQAVSLALIAVLAAVYGQQRGLTVGQSVAVSLLVLGLPSVRFLWQAPILVDLPAMAVALGLAVSVQAELWPLALVLAALAGLTSERAPIFAALFAWHWFPLAGLIATVNLYVHRKPGPDPLDGEAAWAAAHPLAAGWKWHKDRLRDGRLLLWPWGMLVVGLTAMDWPLAVCLLVAYGQLALATDSVRLYQWAAVPLAVATVTVVPIAWLPLLVVAHWMNPWAGDGI